MAVEVVRVAGLARIAELSRLGKMLAFPSNSGELRMRERSEWSVKAFDDCLSEAYLRATKNKSAEEDVERLGQPRNRAAKRSEEHTTHWRRIGQICAYVQEFMQLKLLEISKCPFTWLLEDGTYAVVLHKQILGWVIPFPRASKLVARQVLTHPHFPKQVEAGKLDLYVRMWDDFTMCPYWSGKRSHYFHLAKKIASTKRQVPGFHGCLLIVEICWEYTARNERRTSADEEWTSMIFGACLAAECVGGMKYIFYEAEITEECCVKLERDLQEEYPLYNWHVVTAKDLLACLLTLGSLKGTLAADRCPYCEDIRDLGRGKKGENRDLEEDDETWRGLEHVVNICLGSITRVWRSPLLASDRVLYEPEHLVRNASADWVLEILLTASQGLGARGFIAATMPLRQLMEKSGWLGPGRTSEIFGTIQRVSNPPTAEEKAKLRELVDPSDIIPTFQQMEEILFADDGPQGWKKMGAAWEAVGKICEAVDEQVFGGVKEFPSIFEQRAYDEVRTPHFQAQAHQDLRGTAVAKPLSTGHVALWMLLYSVWTTYPHRVSPQAAVKLGKICHIAWSGCTNGTFYHYPPHILITHGGDLLQRFGGLGKFKAERCENSNKQLKICGSHYSNAYLGRPPLAPLRRLVIRHIFRQLVMLRNNEGVYSVLRLLGLRSETGKWTYRRKREQQWQKDLAAAKRRRLSSVAGECASEDVELGQPSSASLFVRRGRLSLSALTNQQQRDMVCIPGAVGMEWVVRVGV